MGGKQKINTAYLWRVAIRKMLSILPKSTRFALYRNRINLPTELPSNFTFEVARTKADLIAAFTILHDEYVRSGFMKPHKSGMRITPYHALPSTTTLVAKLDGEVIATVSVVRDSPFGFPLEKIFDTKPLRHYGARLAEVSALAIKKEHRQNSGQVLFPLLKFMANYCVSYFGVDYQVIAVNPDYIEFYESIFVFQRLADLPIDYYDYVNGAPAVGGYLDMRIAHKTWLAQYGNKPQEKNIFKYFYEMSFENMKFPDRKYFKVNDPIMTPSLLKYFFIEQSDVIQELSQRDKAILASVYRDERYQEMFPEVQQKDNPILVRGAERFEVKCSGRIFFTQDRAVRLEVFNVSLSGFQARLDLPVRFGERMTIQVVVGNFEIAELTGWPVWSNEQMVYGFVISSYCSHWETFINYLSNDAKPNTISEAIKIAG
jgi:hypothetical protein